MITAIQAKANKHLDLSFTPKEIERYSVANAILGMVDGKDGFEKEVSDTLAAQIGRGPRGLRGIFVPTAVRPQASGLDTKLGSTGGFTTTQGVMDLVDVFRSQLRLTALGAQFLPGLKFNALFPTEDSGTTAFWVSENGLLDVTQTDPVFRASLATPHTLSVTTSVSKQLLVQASTSVALESKLRQDIGRAHATDAIRQDVHERGWIVDVGGDVMNRRTPARGADHDGRHGERNRGEHDRDAGDDPGLVAPAFRHAERDRTDRKQRREGKQREADAERPQTPASANRPRKQRGDADEGEQERRREHAASVPRFQQPAAGSPEPARICGWI